jgi:hypothetical protein
MAAAGLMSLTTLQDSPTNIGAASMSPSKLGGRLPTAYRGHGCTSPERRRRVPITVPSPGRWPGGGRPAAFHSWKLVLRSVRWGAPGHQTSYSWF